MNGLRITLLNEKRRIIYEYDLPQKRWLTRRDALDRNEWKRTLKAFRHSSGIEGIAEKTGREKSTYLISDLHLDHANIIRYCARPFSFSDVNEMNEVLVKNWNSTVKSEDTIYYLGDLVFGRGSRPIDYWLKKLNGNIIFIKGSHDRIKNAKKYEVLHCKDREFLLIHDPKEIPVEWNGWIIHGHKYNNDTDHYPFVNGRAKTINVSAELINYRPLNVDFLLSLNLDSIKSMDTVSSKPIY